MSIAADPVTEASSREDIQARISWLSVPDEQSAPPEVQELFTRSVEQFGFVHNFYKAFALSPDHLIKLAAFSTELFNPEKGSLSPRERELIAVIVSTENRCEICHVSHSALLREITKDPAWVETVGINYRRAILTARERALADFAVRVTHESHRLEEPDLAPLRAVGFSDAAILEATEIIAYFNFTNRLTSALGWRPNRELFLAHR